MIPTRRRFYILKKGKGFDLAAFQISIVMTSCSDRKEDTTVFVALPCTKE